MSKPWPKVKLGEVLTHRKQFITIDELTDYQRPRVQLHVQGVILRDKISGALIKTKKQQVCRKGDFLVAEIDAKVGGFGIVPDNLNGAIVSSHYFLFEVDESKLDRAFLGYFIRTPAFRKQVEAQGSTNYAAIRPSHVLDYEIPLPPLAEQKRVVARIEELAAQIQEARTLRHQATQEAEALTTAKTTLLFERLLQGQRHPIKTLGIDGENPIQIGPFGAQLHKTEFVESGVPVLNVGNVWPTGLRLEYLDHVTKEKAHQLRRYSIKTNDLLFARSGATLGKVCLVPAECDGWLMTGHLFRVRFSPDRVFNRFAFAALRDSLQIQKQIFGQIRGATRPGYNTTLLGNVELPVPPLTEQRRIVAELDALQAEVDALKRLQLETAKELDALLPAILDRAFKGEL
jgi:type I restriction enzyme S subunit